MYNLIKNNLEPYMLLTSVIPILINLILHEYAHAATAYMLGDNTAKRYGRLSLNPLRHLDPVGTILLVFTGFGFAKPVPVDHYNFQNPKKDLAITAIAGPTMNLFIAIISLLFLNIAVKTNSNELCMIVFQTANIGIHLAVFNLLPFPPLDGSKVWMAILPEDKYFKYINNNTTTNMILVALIMFGILTPFLSKISTGIMDIFFDLFCKNITL